MWAALAMLIASAFGAGAGTVDASRFDEQLLQCFETEAQRFDDGHSDARSVAAAVYAACGPLKLAILTVSGMKTQVAHRALHETRDEDIDRATISVLRLRVKAR